MGWTTKTNPKRIPPNAANAAMMNEYIGVADAIPSPVPVAPAPIVKVDCAGKKRVVWG